jgi:hypothetical protein
LVGEYEDPEILIVHAFPDFRGPGFGARFQETPMSRNAFVVTFRTEPIESGAIPDYTAFGDVVCAYLSVLFGKRFDNHGYIQGNGVYWIPDYGMFQSFCDPTLPQNSHDPRIDLEIPLDLSKISLIARLFNNEPLVRPLHFFQTAAGFYLQALQSFDRHREIAYMNLITAVEILSHYFDYTEDELFDESIKATLREIESAIPDRPKLANQVKSLLRQTKRRFANTLIRLVNDYFFSHTESTFKQGVMKQEDFEQRVKATYDLRSRYVHTGIPFGDLMGLKIGGHCPEILGVTPSVGDKELEKLVVRALTYFGLERLVRFSLIRFIHLHAFFIDPRLD